MAHTTEQVGTLDEALSFYQDLAEEYDAMTRFEGRFEREREAFRSVVERHGLQSALDAGCGTGFHALLLAQLGVRMRAVDISPRMIERLREHAAEMGLEVEAEVQDLRSLAHAQGKPVDGLFCMGNTLAHASDRGELEALLRGFARTLRRGGLLFLQVLNYKRILADANLIQNIKERNGVFYLRLYEYGAARIRFHLLRISGTGSDITHALSSVTLTPFLPEEIEDSLRVAGFANIRRFGDIALHPFEDDRSQDLVLLAEGPG